ncbi:hypothetical protein RYZ26_03435 [Terasakiella sp. A23]|uniref:hypothetical protein n=1 Tax=Terasakiella sp. FCG-A23 TaxID=3080561 RepID=UPI00295411B6|nr:hypothetical protein [Terasakiella sp. A23]MDV7338635.1 hypothetical protein [Terasakiella sp. A23]
MKNQKLYKRLHFLLVITGGFPAAFVGLASSPLFPQVGVWHESEPLIIGLFLAGMINAVSVLLGLVLYPNLMRRCLSHPIVLIPIALGFYSLLLIPFGAPALSQLLGSEQTGLGAAWFFCLGIITINARFILRSYPKYLVKVIVITFVFGCVLLSLMTVFGHDRWRMFSFNDHIGFWAIYLWPLIFFVIKRPSFAFLAAIFPCFLIVDLSDNFSAVLTMCGVVFITVLLHYTRSFGLPHQTASKIGAGLGVLTVCFIFTVVWLFDGNSPIYENLSNKIASTMHSRHLLLGVVTDSSFGDVSNLLLGNGWGSFADLMMKNVPFDKTATFFTGNMANIQSDSWIWDSLLRFDFHSHNLFVETLGSIGLVGLFLLLAYFYSLIRYAKPQYFALSFATVIGLILLNSMWFQMPSTLAMMAIAFGALSGEFKMPKVSEKASMAVVGLVALILAYGAVQAQSLAVTGDAQVRVNLGPQDHHHDACPIVMDDGQKNGHHFSELFKNYTHIFNAKLEERSQQVVDQDWQRLSGFLCEADRRLQDNQELVSGVRALMARGDYLYRFREHVQARPALYQAMTEGWQNNLDQVMVLAPKRFDLAVPYFNWLLETGQEADLLKRAEKAVAYEATRPIGLWFSGIVQLNDPAQKDKAISNLKQALSLGIERFFPVEEGLKQALVALPG